MSYANIHFQIEENIKEGHKNKIIFHDLCTTENIRITKDSKVFFIDYEDVYKRQPYKYQNHLVFSWNA